MYFGMKKVVGLIIGFLLMVTVGTFGAAAQEKVQTVKGRVVDNVTEAPLAGIAVVINQSGYLTTYTDAEGYYSIPNVPVGKISLLFSSMGFETVYVENVVLNSGKELVYNTKMQEDITLLQGVVVKAQRERIKVINEMAPVSARTFSVADAERYAGSMNDISRMAQSFAGVGTPSDSSNDIVIRGNSPFGMLWRLEGIDIYNPNHFADGGATGGPVSMLNVNALENSSFYTSAFPAEYGNAFSGVFDISLRNGNYDNYEYTGMASMNGAEVGVEGPFSKKSKASFMAYYRYSFLDLISALGYDFGAGTAVPRYQDWTGKINVPTKKAGTFSLFSIGGFADATLEGGSSFYTYADNIISESGMNVVGLTHKINFGRDKKHSLTSSLAYSNSKFSALIDTINAQSQVKERSQNAFLNRNFLTLQTVYNYKINPKLSLRAGLTGKRLGYEFKSYDFSHAKYPQNVDENGHTYQLQGYAEFVYRMKPWLTLNGGVNGQFLILNNTWAADPRVGAKINLNKNHEFSLGYGLHSQTQGLEIYMTKLFTQSVHSDIYPNQPLNMTRSHHFVLGYQWRMSDNTRFKVEAYYQYLYNIPVDLYDNYYSTLNLGGMDFSKYGRVYVDDGTGENYGLEFTMERFLSKGWYYLGTLSLFESKIMSIDNVVRNTRFNNNYVANLLLGKELELKNKRPKARSQWSVGFDLKGAFAGGQRYIPVNVEATRQEGQIVYNNALAFEPRLPYYMRFDVKAWARINLPRLTHEIGVEIKNVTNRKNVYSYGFDLVKMEESTSYQTGLLPLGYYRITF